MFGTDVVRGANKTPSSSRGRRRVQTRPTYGFRWWGVKPTHRAEHPASKVAPAPTPRRIFEKVARYPVEFAFRAE